MFRIRTYLINTYLACFDLAVSASCYMAVSWVEPSSDGRLIHLRDLLTPGHALPLGFVLLLWLTLSLYFRLYYSRRLDSPFADLIILVKVGLASWVILEGIAHLLPALEPTRYFFFRFVALNFLVQALARSVARLVVRELRRRGHDVKRLVLVTSPELRSRLTEKIEQRAHYGYRILRHFLYSGSGEDEKARLLEEVREYLRSARIDDVILALPAQANDVAAQLVVECESQGTIVRIVPDLFPLIQSDTQVYDLDGIPLVNVHLYPTEYFRYAILKRAFDILVSLAVLIFFSPVYLTIAFLVKLTSPGPVLFAQERVGLNGRKFRRLKFRTMRLAPALNSDSHWTVPNDPHVTPVGRWLRCSNLDELPQFLNVLKGDMSVVGPPPERPFFPGALPAGSSRIHRAALREERHHWLGSGEWVARRHLDSPARGARSLLHSELGYETGCQDSVSDFEANVLPPKSLLISEGRPVGASSDDY